MTGSAVAPGPTTGWVRSTDGVEVAVHDHGGDGPPVVFCHATGLHGRIWDPIIAGLTDRHRCLALDLRGHGDARFPPDVSLAWQGMADDLLAVIDAEGLGPGLRAVGHSMGGCAIVLAEQRRPGTIAAAWLFEPIIIPPGGGPFGPGGENPLAVGARRRREIFASREEAFERYHNRPPFDRCDPVALRAYVDHGFRDQLDGTVILKCRGEHEARTFEASRTDAFEHLEAVQAAVTVAGSGDGHGPALIAPLVADALPRGVFEPWPDLTHFAPLEAPERLAAAIGAALG